MAAVLQRNALDSAREVGLPVLAFSFLLLLVAEVVPPAELLEKHVIELGISRRDLGALRVHAVLGKQIHAVLLDAEVGAEAAAAVHDVLRGVVEVGRAGVLDLRRAVAWP